MSETTAETVWYAVHTRPQAEHAALQNLLRQGYSAYLPCYRTTVTHARRRRMVSRPLFPRYLFAGLDRSRMPWRPILSTFGVSGVVRAGDEPVAVGGEIVSELRGREAAGLFDRLARGPALRVGELVRVTAGAFEEMAGRLLELDDHERVVVLLEVLGREVRTRLGAVAVKAA